MEEGIVIDTTKPLMIVLHLLTALSTGWVEEILCRGVVVTALLQKWGRTKKGIYLSVLAGSVIFGLAHLANLLMGRKPLLNNLTQVTFAIFFGVIFAACVLRNRSIWPMMLLHAAIDWAGTLDEIAVGGGLRLTDPVITSPIIGPRSLEQLHDNLGAAGMRLTAEEKQALDEASSWK